MELLERVGLPAEFAKRYPAQLSGGQQQRVGVARALAADPPVMLMDEPFSAVDPVVRGQLQDEFLRLQGELGKTIVFVTHDIDEAIKLGDQVAVLRVGGKLAQLATPAELLTARPTTSSPASSGATAATARSASSAAGQLPPTPEATVQLGERRGRCPLGHRRLGARDRRRQEARSAGTTSRRRRRLGRRRRPARVRSTSAAPLRTRAARCARRSTRRFPRRPGAACWSTRAVSCSARSAPARCSSGSRPPDDRQAAARGARAGVPSGVDWTFLQTTRSTIAGWFCLARLARRHPGGDRPGRRPADRLADEPLPMDLPAAGLDRRRALHDPLDRALRRAARRCCTPRCSRRSTWWSRSRSTPSRCWCGSSPTAWPSVPTEVAQAATAMGFKGPQRLVRVELPIAVPVIAAGLRVATVANVSLVAVGSADRRAPAGPAVHRRLPGRVVHPDRAPGSCSACCWP